MVTTDPGYTDFVLARQGRLRRAAYLMCGDASLAEDLLQEALIALASRWESVEHPDAFVRRVIYRQRVSAWRRQRHEVVNGDVPERSVTDGAEERARDEEVHDALRALPPRQRAALVLRYFEDLTEAQTAEVMGVRIGTVKSLSHQAVARMREELQAGRAAQREKEGTR
ncbi:SigE family RNA polymerase sigma factor [Ornithinimicrobium pekingense]|uniref:RNA polymerase sigma factor n=1 Tax=Ornithinimicrobium pekingense TaxID=384677 RepID=A0ABQ2F4L3_9MICO|nr:SigE family RNA polymerase sigma factor [Ornithinimicrobium pekingense]GGK61438.1 RNA polymerase sigma factor [Ornithinimicrobium pekingense]